jgi:hypothetical protein
MRIKRRTSLGQAEQVLAELENINNNDILSECILEVFDNNREQGYCLKDMCNLSGKTLKIAFAGNRHSDAIVIYSFYDNEHGSNRPKDESQAWDRSVKFMHDELKEAAQYIKSKIIEHQARVKAQAETK